MFLGGLWTSEGLVSVGREMGGWGGALSQFDAAWTVDLGQLAGDGRLCDLWCSRCGVGELT